MKAFIALFCLMAMSWTALADTIPSTNYAEFSDEQGLLEKLISRVNLMNKTSCFLDINFKQDLTLKAKEKYLFIEQGQAQILENLAPRKSGSEQGPVSCLFSFKNEKSDRLRVSLNETVTFRRGAVLMINEIVDILGNTFWEKQMGTPYVLLLRGLDFGVALKCDRKDGQPMTLGDVKETLRPFADVLMLCPVP